MFRWIVENIGTIAVCAVLLGICAAVITGMIRAKKSGRPSCGCDCSHCSACCGCAQAKDGGKR